MPTKNVITVCWLVLLAILGHSAFAASGLQGIYLISDPYTPSQLASLQAAALAPCPAEPSVSPFCGTVSGVLLRFNWCSFQLNPGSPNSSCHYFVDSTGAEIPSTETASPCAATFDTCAQNSPTPSVLGQALQAIAQINGLRAHAKPRLPPLALSLGIVTGAETPEAVLDDPAIGTIDGPMHTGRGFVCAREPRPWQPAYATAYNAALDQLVAFVTSQQTGSPIAIVKIAPVGAITLELDVPAQFFSMPVGVDSGLLATGAAGPAGPNGLLQCPQPSQDPRQPALSGAQEWLNTYTADPVAGLNFSQAMETMLGTVTGHQYAALKNAGLADVELSIPTNNSSVFADIDCGMDGTSPCAVQQPMDQWSTYYLIKYVDDLFNSGVSGAAASSAAAALGQDWSKFEPVQLAVNFTGLTVPEPQCGKSMDCPSESLPQLTCNINNKAVAHAPTFVLDGVASPPVVGVGTTIAWQTQTNQAAQFCIAQQPNYASIMDFGISNGGQFIEVEPDAAMDNACGHALSVALSAIVKRTPPGHCLY